MNCRISVIKVFVLSILLSMTSAFIPKPLSINRSCKVVRGERSGDFESEDLNNVNNKNRRQCTVTPSGDEGGIENVFHTLGDYNDLNSSIDEDDIAARNSYDLNKGKALEALRRQLPLVFFASNLDFSIFAPEIVVNDGKNRFAMPYNVYTTVVKSLKLASSFSTMYPSMNVRKIEYLEDCSTIQCLVDVVLPDSIRIDGASSWEGMFYFGLDSKGLISSHTFDKKISGKTPNRNFNTKAFPWIQNKQQWSPELLAGAALIKSVEENKSDGDSN